MKQEIARKQALEQLHERRTQVVQSRQKAINIMQIFTLAGLSYPAVRATLNRLPVRTKAKQREAPNSYIIALEKNPERVISCFQDRRVLYAEKHSSGRSSKNA